MANKITFMGNRVRPFCREDKVILVRETAKSNIFRCPKCGIGVFEKDIVKHHYAPYYHQQLNPFVEYKLG